MARLKSELQVTCPCCQAALVIDLNLGRVISHAEPERGPRPELSEAQRIIAEEAARREAIFEQSVSAEKTRGDPHSHASTSSGGPRPSRFTQNAELTRPQDIGTAVNFPAALTRRWLEAASGYCPGTARPPTKRSTSPSRSMSAAATALPLSVSAGIVPGGAVEKPPRPSLR